MKTKIHRFLAMALSILMLAGILAGCASDEPAAPANADTNAAAPADSGNDNSSASNDNNSSSGNDNTSSKPEVLNVWLPPNGATDEVFWNNAVAPFEEEHNVDVVIQIIGWSNYEDKYVTAISAGEGPDIGYMYSTIFPDFINKGAIAPLDSFITDADRDNYIYLDLGNFMGGQYGLPFIVGNPRIMFYNKDLLAAAGIPEPSKDNPPTWDEFIEICQQLTLDTDGDGEIDQWGMNFSWGDPTYAVMQNNFFPYVMQAGGTFFNDEGTECLFGSEAGVKAAEFVKSMVYDYHIVPDNCTGVTNDDVKASFLNGQTAFITIPTAEARALEGVNWGWFPALKGERAVTMGVCDSLAMMSACENKELAWELLKFMTSNEVMTGYHAEIAKFPPIAKDEEYHDDPAFEELYTKYSDMISVFPAAYKSYQICDHLYKNLQMVMMDEMEPREAVEEAAQYGTSVLAEVVTQ